MSNNVYLNGRYTPAEQACVPILDRGFMFGDGVYEVMPVYSGKPFAQAQHLARLQRSLDAIQIPNPMSPAQWDDVFAHLIEQNCAGQDAAIYLQVTRGVMEKRDHVFSHDMQPTVLVMTQTAQYPSQSKETKGIRVITQEDTRWQDCHIKSINLLPNVLLKQYAVEHDAEETILIRNGLAIEGSASNLFIVKDDIIRTPPQNRCMLGGITREVILELCQQHKVVAREIDISEDELHDADEIWMTSSTREISPVTTLNQHKVGNGEVGPKWHQVIDLYQAFKQTVMRGGNDTM